MKPLALALLTPLLFQAATASAAIDSCYILWGHVLGYTPREICEKYGGYKCSSSKTDGELLCRAGGRMDECVKVQNSGEALCMLFGRICVDVTSELKGLCLATGESVCDKPNPDRRFWLLKLMERCGKPLE